MLEGKNGSGRTEGRAEPRQERQWTCGVGDAGIPTGGVNSAKFSC